MASISLARAAWERIRGKAPKKSVINSDHRAHDVPNLFIVDGSSFVTSGRGQPTMTIQALAFRAADRIAALAKTRSLYRVDPDRHQVLHFHLPLFSQRN